MGREPYYGQLDTRQQGPARLQCNIPQPQPQYMQSLRPIPQRERYRATLFDCPMYDAVEDDEYGQDVQLDAFDERMLQQAYNDRQYQAAQGRGRLSLAPAPTRSYDSHVIERQQPPLQSKSANREIFEFEDEQANPVNEVRNSLSRFVYNAHEPLESSSDAPFGAPSSPALNAGRRRAGQLDNNASQRSSQFYPLKYIPGERGNDRQGNIQYQHYNQRPQATSRRNIGHSSRQVANLEPPTHKISVSQVPPTVQGIPLVPVSALPDRLRTVFPFPNFNAVQSKCFDQAFKSDDNFVLSSPTGSGKTAILELAICRAVASNSTDQYKIVYQAPTKALCSERQRDWQTKFMQIGLKCAEFTGDSDTQDLRKVQGANIIVTTPEKWDSMTRKWKDRERLMRLIKLFLIDEVHILNDDRGAVLEAVVSRMKSIGTDIRFVALSATVPNFHDVAAWLGRNPKDPHSPAPNEKFGEDFRPVKLRKHVLGYIYNSNNDFAFEKQLDTKLPEVITRYSDRKPMIIFCPTRNSCVLTAQLLANWWESRTDQDRLWSPPLKGVQTQDKNNCNLIASGVAFHHAGVDHNDRFKIEQAFLNGNISVICCTSTLAVGVNLPCHLVIIKNTVVWSQEGAKEYSDLEMMQMLGRAGRPQFDDSAVAVIMTRQSKVRRYESLMTGEEVLESKLHLNLIDHLNAEIGLGTIRDLDSARKWLVSTFLYVRLQRNSAHYKLAGSRSGQDIQEQVDDICYRDITLLREHNLASGEEHFRCTEFGHAMARYYVKYETMRVFMGLQPKSTLSEVLSAVSQAAEFSKIRFRQGEKILYKMINKSPSIRFPIPVNLDLPAQKVSLIIQSVLGHAEINWEGDMAKYRAQYQQEVISIFRSINSLVRCIIDCQICLGDSVSIHSALMLERCIGSKAWDDSPLQMVQVPGIGTVAVRKLVNAGIRSLEDLEGTDARRIETIVGRNPPFGLKVLETLKSFPKLRVSLHIQPFSVTETPGGVKIQVKADIGFINETTPSKFGDRLIYVCMLAETSDGRKIHFARINGLKLGLGQNLVFPALLTSPDQKINCYLMCEGIAGSMRDAMITPKIAPSMFPAPTTKAAESAPTHQPNMSRRRVENLPAQRRKSIASDDFGDDDLDDDALVRASCSDLDFEHIDNFTDPMDAMTRSNTVKNKPAKEKGRAKASAANNEDDDSAPVQLSNGRWSCNHKCKDREACKHYCCKHGLDKPPKKSAPKRVPLDERIGHPTPKSSTQKDNNTQTKLQLQASKRKNPTAIEELDLTQQEKKHKTEYAISGPRDYRDPHNLHQSVQKNDLPASLHSVMKKKPEYCYDEGGGHQLSFLSQPNTARPKTSSEYSDLQVEDFVTSALRNEQPDSIDLISQHFSDKALSPSHGSNTFDDEDSLFGEAIVGLADSQGLQSHNSGPQNNEASNAIDIAKDSTNIDFPTNQNSVNPQPAISAQLDRPHKPCAAFSEFTRRPQQTQPSKRAKSTLQQDRREPQQDRPAMSLASCDPPVKAVTPVRSIEAEQDGPEQVPEGFEGLQPWLFREFGDIVELVDDE